MAETTSSKEPKLLNALFIRLFVLSSLFIQIVLIATGNRRKYTRKKRVAATLWLSYLLADYIATTALGFLSKSRENNDPRDAVMAFWAPFLLMHLGGPDTITAYALADNELWLRHAIGLLGQVSVAVYVLYRSWAWRPINYLSIVIFLAGLIKYGERTLVLFSASRDEFRESLVTPPDPGPNYPKFTNELVSKELEGFRASPERTIDIASSPSSVLIHPSANVAQELIPDAVDLHEAYYFFGTFKKLFADLILSFHDKDTTLSFFRRLSWDKAFSIVEIELGLIYDLFYTKAFILYTPHGFCLRVLTIFSTLASLVAFVFIHLNDYPKFKVVVPHDVAVSLKTEVIVTYVLLGGAILLEMYAILVLLSSDRMMIWLSGDWTKVPQLLRNFKSAIVFIICKTVCFFRYFHAVPAKMRWSNVMGQYNVLNCCFESEPKCAKVYGFLQKKYFFWESVSVPKGLKALIFNELKKRSQISGTKLSSYWVDEILLLEMRKFEEDHGVAEFDQSLLLWHMATDFCYYSEVGENHKPERRLLEYIINDDEDDQFSEENMKFRREICKLLSDYMLHLLIMSPFMLPGGIGKIRFQDTRAEAIVFFEEQKMSQVEACEMLRQVDTRLPPSRVKGDRSKSILFDACRLAKSLQQSGEKWKIMSEAWLNILTFAAAQCSWSDHAEKLSQGGELLTHVWLLMAHFGMTNQFQITKGYIRAKLNLK